MAPVSPLVVCPEQVGSEDDSDVSRRHLVQILVLGQFGEELDQIPVFKTERQTDTCLNYTN